MAGEIEDSFLQSDLKIEEKNSPKKKINNINNFAFTNAYTTPYTHTTAETNTYTNTDKTGNDNTKAYTKSKFKFPRVKQLKPGQVKWN